MFAEGWRPRPRLYAVTAVLLLVHAAGVQARSNSKGNRAYRERKARCELESCSQFVPEEAMNCLHQCISPACYQSIYAAEPVRRLAHSFLEDGEVDLARSRAFINCFKKELRQQSMVRLACQYAARETLFTSAVSARPRNGVITAAEQVAVKHQFDSAAASASDTLLSDAELQELDDVKGSDAAAS
eukprot:20066-Heterococcus_DN1.PRE.3